MKELDKRIRSRLISKTGGIPDVAAWDPDRPLETVIFVECKGPREDIKEGQEDWVAAAFEHGLTPENFAVAVRPFV
ncbi:MAG: VRR-NUC domain-containing protein [Rubrobacter sp.]|nr:VRR-NUC domain-containing protein [Rubrobacter sp.]